MDHYASEQEQVDQIKRWWKDNGKSLIFGLVIGVGGLAGYRYWDASETIRAENASISYEQFLQMVQGQQLEQANTTGQAIIDNYAGSTYARLSALMLAKLAVDAGDNERAKTLLTRLLEDRGDSHINAVARARLARIHLAEGDSTAAAGMMDLIPATADNERFLELRGDVLKAAGDYAGAREKYLMAIAQAEKLGLERGAIQLKLDNLGGAASDGGS